MSTDFGASRDQKRGLRHVSRCLNGTLCVAGLLMLAADVRAQSPADAPGDLTKASTPLERIAGVLTPAPEPAGDPANEPEVAAHYQAALANIDGQQFDKAVSELDTAIALAHDVSYELLYALARAERGLGNPGAARLAAEQAAIRRPGDLAVHLLLGRLHHEQHRLDSAIAHFRAATRAAERELANPQATLSWYELGQSLAQDGYYAAATEALEHFDRAVWEEQCGQQHDEEIAAILKQRPYGAIEQRMELLQRLHRPDELVRVAEWAFKNRPDEPYLERLYVRTLLETGHAAQAFDFCRQRLAAVATEAASEPSSAARTTALWNSAIETGQAADRLGEWVNELAAGVGQGHHVAVARHLARRLDDAHDYALSIPLWRALVAAQPAAADAAWALAGALKGSGNLAAALDGLTDFVRQNADTVDIPPERLAAWMSSFQVTDGFLQLVQERSRREDCDFACYIVLGSAAAGAGQTELAARLFASALEQRPGFALTHIAWARMLLGAYRWEEALAQAEQALAAAPHSPAACFVRAEAHAGLDEIEQAEQAYKMAIERRPQEAAYVLALARLYHRTGNLLGAQRYFQQAWSLDHALAPAVEELVDCYLEGGKVEIARECLKQAEARDLPDDTLRRIRTTLRFASTPLQAEHRAELARQFEQHPDDVTTGLKLAAGLFINHQAGAALPVLRQVQARAPEDERLIYLLAEVHLQLLEFDQAITGLEEGARRYPRRKNVLRFLGRSYLADFRVEHARQTWARVVALESAPDARNQLRAGLLASYLDFQEFDAALELVEKWIAETPDEPAWERAKLRVLQDAGRGPEAVAYAETRLEPATRRFEELRDRYKATAERIRRTADEADGQTQLKNLERDLGAAVGDLYTRREEYVDACLGAAQFDAAEEQVRTWLKDQPEQPQLQEWLIEVLLGAKRGEQALDVIGTLTLKNQTDVLKAMIWKARAAALVGRREDGINDLKNLASEPFIKDSQAASAQVRQEIITLLIGAPDYERAATLCDRWLADTPANEKAVRFNLLGLKASVLGATDRQDEQIAVMKEMLEIQPHDPGTNNDLGYTWVDRGEELERSLAMIRLAVAAEPGNSAFLDSLGWAYYKAEDFDAARKYLARAVRVRGGQDPTVYDHLADAAYRLGDRTAAREHWQQALTLLDKTEREQRMERDVKLMAAVRAKLAALDRGEAPAIAPTGAGKPGGTYP